MSYQEIVNAVSASTGINKTRVDKIYKAYWRAVREYIEALSLKEDLTEEEFLKLKPNINIPSIGKLYVTPDRYKRVKYIYNKLNS